MIRDQWYVILQTKELKKGKPVGVTRMGEKLVLWRDGYGKPVCQADLCPHRGAALSAGRLSAERIQCPFHGFEFDSSGQCTFIPANGLSSTPPRSIRVKTYPVRESHGYIYLWWGEPRPDYPPLPWFDDLDESFTTAEIKNHWAVHYSRAIENQLDVFHLPFVHATTIGKGGRTISDGPVIEIDDNELKIWVYNRIDDGRTGPRRAAELPPPLRSPLLRFIFPHLWMNRISDDLRITVYFTPIDDENCMLYLRSYQRFMRLPVLRNIVTWFFNPSNLVILNQDKRVVLGQRPVKSALRMEEKLIQADRPIIEYRRIRRDLQLKAGQKVE